MRRSLRESRDVGARQEEKDKIAKEEHQKEEAADNYEGHLYGRLFEYT
jgi:hypothetical protein